MLLASRKTKHRWELERKLLILIGPQKLSSWATVYPPLSRLILDKFTTSFRELRRAIVVVYTVENFKKTPLGKVFQIDKYPQVFRRVSFEMALALGYNFNAVTLLPTVLPGDYILPVVYHSADPAHPPTLTEMQENTIGKLQLLHVSFYYFLRRLFVKRRSFSCWNLFKTSPETMYLIYYN